MKKIFLDTNIIIDIILDRQPFSKYSIEILKKAENNELELYISSHTIATTHYILKKILQEKTVRDILINLIEIIQIIPIDATVIKKGLKSKHKDFEDALQIICAYTIGDMDCIVTRNIKDFKGSEIPVFSPDELVLKLK